jgi:peptidyl-prolyl cis-trans isomerase SurA
MVTMIFSLLRWAPRTRLLALAGAMACSVIHAQTTMASAAASGRDFIVAVVDTVPITNHEVNARVAQMRQQLTQQGRNVPETATLLRDALERLIGEKAQLQHAKETGVVVDDAALEQATARMAEDPKTITTRQRQELRDQLTLQRLAERNVPARIKISESDIEQAIRERQNATINTNPDIELGHIFIAVPETASNAQVAELQAKAQNTLARVKRGEDFGVVAKEVSQSAERDKGGLMGVRPADRYPSLFVEATQALSVGEVSAVVRSGAGFHILKLVNKRNANTVTITETRARHILLRPSGQLSQVAARAQLANYKREIEAGRADFAKLAQAHSQDASAPGGGDLGWVAPGMFVPEFEEVMNKLQPNQIADPAVSRFGVHLIQVLARREAPVSERELREMVRNKLREQKYEEAYQLWAQEVRGRTYVEYRDPPQ